mmetsp:Transcript_2885/g.4354  ORF Transcript_2885/g.4354 Transcript_2885/m.4354 type:complete len:232 (+) Transcript_2885:99-794(+)|eukprot:CAMPEP_0197238686 /NCGR_PEP_ID=MMETSP1429-20130617/5211_1 /TAXON_ID=49237 /ORGANISM="Chaetoceros  sp., Strain UNC1202" /LENGTH=231 /DNA_ID=CAMNT_0042697919 /DNA_START=82 /DNA_END=777 /DNA_ORIENTATION=-
MSEEASATTTTDESVKGVSALEENLEAKGKNSYFYAFGDQKKGPEWDGNEQPKLLSKNSSAKDVSETPSRLYMTDQESKDLLENRNHKKASFCFKTSNITKYAFIDEGRKVKIYIELKGVGAICDNEEDVTLDWDKTSFSLVIRNYQAPEGSQVPASVGEDGILCLSFGRLHGPITRAFFKKKANKIILTLVKYAAPGQYPTQWVVIGGNKVVPEEEKVLDKMRQEMEEME